MKNLKKTKNIKIIKMYSTEIKTDEFSRVNTEIINKKSHSLKNY